MIEKYYYLDTNICVFILRGKYKNLRDRVFSLPSNIKIPSMVKAELLVGALKSKNPEKEIEKVNDFCKPFEIVPFDNEAIWTYAKIRSELEIKGTPISSNDLIIAATVLSRNGILVTNNTKEFSRIEGLLFLDWTQE